MTEKPGNFFGGFILGAIAGSALGVVLGDKLNKILASNLTDFAADEADISSKNPAHNEESAKRGLEQKIARLNAAIDAVSRELNVSEKNGKLPQKSPQSDKL